MMRGVVISLLVVGLGCSGDSSRGPLRVGRDGPGGAAGEEQTAGFGGPGGAGVGGSAEAHALTAEIHDPEGLRIELVTLSCDGECAEVEAVASGGFPPYRFRWDDDSTAAARRLCADATTVFTVEVEDTAIDLEEFQYEAQHASAAVTAEVIGCDEPDGGAPPGELCLENPSIEGTPGTPLFTPFDATPWDACPQSAAIHTSIGNETVAPPEGLLAPTDGASYGVIAQDSGFGGRGVLAQSLCAPIEPGSSVSFFVDLARIPMQYETEAEVAVVEVRGGGARCAEEQSLWTSPPLTGEWTTHCVTLTPAQRVESLSFNLYGDGGELFLGLATVMIDNIVPVDRCP